MSSSMFSIPQDALSNSILDSSSEGEELPAAGDGELQGLSLSLTSALQTYQQALAEFVVLVLGEDCGQYHPCGHEGCSALFLDKFSLSLHEYDHSS